MSLNCQVMYLKVQDNPPSLLILIASYLCNRFTSQPRVIANKKYTYAKTRIKSIAIHLNDIKLSQSRSTIHFKQLKRVNSIFPFG